MVRRCRARSSVRGGCLRPTRQFLRVTLRRERATLDVAQSVRGCDNTWGGVGNARDVGGARCFGYGSLLRCVLARGVLLLRCSSLSSSAGARREPGSLLGGRRSERQLTGMGVATRPHLALKRTLKPLILASKRHEPQSATPCAIGSVPCNARHRLRAAAVGDVVNEMRFAGGRALTACQRASGERLMPQRWAAHRFAAIARCRVESPGLASR